MEDRTYTTRIPHELYAPIKFYCIHKGKKIQDFIASVLKDRIDSDEEIQKYIDL